MKGITKRLSNAFALSRMSFEDLALKTGIPKSALYRYINGETPKIPLERFESICNALDLDAAELLGWKPVTWDHTIHEWPKAQLPPEITLEHEEEPKQISTQDQTKILQALGALGRVDMESAVTLFKALIEQKVI